MGEQFSLSFILKLVDYISTPLTQMGTAFDDISRKYDNMGKGMRDMGSKLTKGVTAPILGWGAYAIYQAREMSGAFLGMQDRFEGATGELAKFREQLINISMESPHSAAELLRLGAAGLQVGVANDKIVDFSKTMADFGLVTGMSGERATQALKEFSGTVGAGYDDYKKILNVAIDLGNSMNTTGERVLETSRQIGGIGKWAGMSIPEIQALAGWMNSMGEDTGAHMTLLLEKMHSAAKFGRGADLGMFSRIIYGDPSKTREFQAGMKESPAEMIAKFVEGLTRAQKQGADVMKELEQFGLGGMKQVTQISRLAQSTDVLRTATERANTQWQTGNEVIKTAQARYETFGGQLAMLKNTQAAIGAEFGKVLIPVLKVLNEMFREFLKGFTKLPDWMKASIVGVLGLAAAIGPLLVGLGAFKGILAAVGVSVPLVLALAAAFAAVGAAVYQLTKHWETISAGGFLESITDFGKWLVNITSGGLLYDPDWAMKMETPYPVSGGNKSRHEVSIKLNDPRLSVDNVNRKEGAAKLDVDSPLYGNIQFGY